MAHIGNIAALAVAVNVALVIAFGSLLWTPAVRHRASQPDGRVSSE